MFGSFARKETHIHVESDATADSVLGSGCCPLLLSPLAAGRSSFPFQTAAKIPSGADRLGLPAPEFELQQIFGNSVKSSDLKGKVVVLDLFPTWCAPCVDEIPNLQAIADKYRGKNVQVVGIAVESGSMEDVKARIAELKVRYPVLFGTKQTSSDFRIIGYPATFVLTRNWTFYHIYVGKQPNRTALIDKQIESLLP